MAKRQFCKPRITQVSPHPARYLVFHAPRRVKKRVRVISGSDAEVQNALAYIVAPENMPSPVGEKALDFPMWLAECARNETRT